MRAGKDGVYTILINLLGNKEEKFCMELSEKDTKLIKIVLETLTALMDMQPDLLDQKGVDLIKW